MSRCNILPLFVFGLVQLFLSDILCWWAWWVHLLKGKLWPKRNIDKTANYWQQVLFQLPNSYLIEIYHHFPKNLTRWYLKQHQSNPDTTISVHRRHENLCIQLKINHTSLGFVVKIPYDGPSSQTIFPFLMIIRKTDQRTNNFHFIFLISYFSFHIRWRVV